MARILDSAEAALLCPAEQPCNDLGFMYNSPDQYVPAEQIRAEPGPCGPPGEVHCLDILHTLCSTHRDTIRIKIVAYIFKRG